MTPTHYPWPPDDVPPWQPVLPPLVGVVGERSAKTTIDVLSQFPLQAPRYRAIHDSNGKHTTWCNIYVWDCTRALSCEIPHWVDAHGERCAVGQGWELMASGFERYLGAHSDWHRCLTAYAVDRARAGHPVVATWYNPRGPGHVAMVLPTSTQEQVRIAQAGAANLWDAPLRDGFGHRSGEVVFWWHD